MKEEMVLRVEEESGGWDIGLAETARAVAMR